MLVLGRKRRELNPFSMVDHLPRPGRVASLVSAIGLRVERWITIWQRRVDVDPRTQGG
jgi:hypothetical protein